ncbi:MAG TPA: hypothetical protein VGB73_13575 [Pyrinomonadaceae bacterium]
MIPSAGFSCFVFLRLTAVERYGEAGNARVRSQTKSSLARPVFIFR